MGILVYMQIVCERMFSCWCDICISVCNYGLVFLRLHEYNHYHHVFDVGVLVMCLSM